jgi:serine/threonine protein phosphatase PrpC
MEYTTALDIGKRKRQQGGINEDSVAVSLVDEGHRDTDRRAGVFVLADGAGGADAGDVASYVATVEVARRLTERLWDARRFAEVLPGEEPVPADFDLGEDAVGEPLATVDADHIRDSIEAAIQAAHARLLEVITDIGVETAYSTVVAGVKVGDRLHYGWVGDSRIYAVNTAPSVSDDDRVQLLTRDHSVVEQLVDQGEIDEVEAHVHRRGNRVTRALGGARGEDPDRASIAVDTNTVPLFRDDVVLLTSDGLLDAYIGAPKLHQQYEQAEDTAEIERTILERSVTDDEIREVIMDADSLALAGERFVSLSNERGGKDNVSVILFRDSDLPQTPANGPPIRGAATAAGDDAATAETRPESTDDDAATGDPTGSDPGGGGTSKHDDGADRDV